MSIEQGFNSSHVFKETILTIDDDGREVERPLADIAELFEEPYHWKDAMTIEFDDTTEGEKL